ncbi:MAG: hypothetical protein C0179_01505 [Fervidicoccus sp.]|jgi:dihydroorotate dehydrogenase (NAD+) catalytic subunit|nr:MAG: hypothetical protein C0179_01505 [Fervidicoccus sp.]
MVIRLADFNLKNPILLAGGMINDEFIFKAIELGIGAVTLGTYSSTILSTHPKPWLYRIPGTRCFVNSYGIRHSYIEKEKVIRRAISEAKERKTIVVCSYIERSPEESLKAIKFFEEVGCDILEINTTPLLMGCTVPTNSKNSFDERSLIELINDFLLVAMESSMPISIKFPSTVFNVVEAWKQFKQTGASIAHVMNAAIPAFVIGRAGEPYFRTQSGMGGLTGECIKPISIAKVRTLSRMGEKNIIGTGGVMSVSDVKDYLDSGASAVGVHSIIYVYGIKGLGKIIEESEELFRK